MVKRINTFERKSPTDETKKVLEDKYLIGKGKLDSAKPKLDGAKGKFRSAKAKCKSNDDGKGVPKGTGAGKTKRDGATKGEKCW